MFDSILLGIVQGLTEFLPVSSSAHLVFTQSLLGWNQPELLFDIMLHIATLAAVLVFFRADILRLFNLFDKDNRRYILLLAAATVPTGLIGFLGKDIVESAFTSVLWPAVFLLITGVLLAAAQRFGKGFKTRSQITFIDALIIGIVQGIAVLPGISRSGSTIAASMLLGIEKTEAAKFSFFLAIPAIMGAAVLGFKDFQPGSQVAISGYAAGSVFAFIFGLISIFLVFKALVKNKLSYFAYYCWALGLAVIIYTALH